MIQRALLLIFKDLSSSIIKISGNNQFEVDGLMNKVKEHHKDNLLLSTVFNYEELKNASFLTVDNIGDKYDNNRF